MRLFAQELIPGLRLSAAGLPAPWILPSSFHRAHRDRLVSLLAHALRGVEPELMVVQLGWAERGLLERGRVRLDPPCLVWWRIDTLYKVDPREALRTGTRLAPGPVVFDFDEPHGLPALGWLGALKLEVLRCIGDVLLDRTPLPEAEEILRALKELSEQLISPVDLLDAAEVLIFQVAEARPPSAASDIAVSHVLASRFDNGIEVSEEEAERIIMALSAIGTRKKIGEDDMLLLQEHGLAEGGELFPPAALLSKPRLLRNVLLQLSREFEVSAANLSRLVPDVFPLAAPSSPPLDLRRHEFFDPLDGWPNVELSELRTPVTLLAAAKEMLNEGRIEEAVRQLERAERRAHVSSKETLGALAAMYRACALRLIARHPDETESTYQRAAAWLGRAADLFKSFHSKANHAEALYLSGLARFFGHQDDQARQLLDQARARGQELGNPRLQVQCVAALANLLLSHQEIGAAWELLSGVAGPLSRKLGDARVKAWVLHRLALLERNLESARTMRAEALDLLRSQVLPAYQAASDLRSQVRVLKEIADYQYFQPYQYPDAIRLYEQEILPLYEELDDPGAQADAWQHLAALYQGANWYQRWDIKEPPDPDKPLRLLQDKVLPLRERVGSPGKLAETYWVLANVHAGRGSHDQALRLYEQKVLPVYASLWDRYRLTLSRMATAYCYLQRDRPGDEDRASELLRLALQDARDLRLREVEVIEKMLQQKPEE